MARILCNGTIVEDAWTLLQEVDAGPTEANRILPLASWLKLRDTLPATLRVGVWLASDETVEAIVPDLPRLAVVALHFPAFTDGRHYSSGYLLRGRYHYAGEVRAFGDVRRDTIGQLQRCGFNAFVPRAGDTAEHLLEGSHPFSFHYQAAADDRPPLFRVRNG